jgi:hypothetical protein
MQKGSERWLRVLGLDPGASEQAVKEAYRDLVKVWHPDRFGTDARLREKAQTKLTEVNAAYEHLRNYRPSDPFAARPPQRTPVASASPPPGTVLSTHDTSERPHHRAAHSWGMAAAFVVTAAVGSAGVWLYLSGLHAADASVNTSETVHAPASPTPTPQSLPAHAAARQTINAAPAATRTPASEAATTGSLLVDSQPLGGRVFLDGELMGETSLLVTDVTPGEHQIRIEFATRGYQPWTSPVVVAAGRREKLLAVMTRASPPSVPNR